MQSDDQAKIRDTGNEIKVVNISNALNQNTRIRWLKNAEIISDTDRQNLIFVHRLRANYFHRWSTKTHNQKKDALKALERISKVSSKFLELLGSGSQRINLLNYQRVKQYMEIVNSPNNTIKIPVGKNKMYKLIFGIFAYIKQIFPNIAK